MGLIGALIFGLLVIKLILKASDADKGKIYDAIFRVRNPFRTKK